MFADRLLAAFYRLGWRGLGDGLICWFRGNHGSQFIKFRTPGGAPIWLNPKNFIDHLLLTQGHHDREVLEALDSQVRSGDVFWDIGANIGLMTMDLMHRHPDLRAVCFEPSPFTFSQLFLNNQLQGSRALLQSVALSDFNGTALFSLKVNRNSGMSTLHPEGRFSYDFSIRVACARADSLVAEGLPAPNVIKIDIEGAEFSALKGMGELLRREELRAVVFEGPTKDHDAILRLLGEAGFGEIRKLTDESFTNFIAIRHG